jgi:hypothetical protein
MYVVTASPDPGNVQCYVPCKVNEKWIFFGPCKKRLRERFRKEFLNGLDDNTVSDDIYIVGVNGANPQRVRKILWAGRVLRIMTFEAAFNQLNGSDFKAMRMDDHCPLHVKPVYDKTGAFQGYQSNSLLHRSSWTSDLLSSLEDTAVRFTGNQVLLNQGVDRNRVFNRDCCFLLENIFFAGGNGINIEDQLIEALKEVQPDKQIDSYAVFGYRADGSVDGLTGRCLEITGPPAEHLSSLIRSKARRTGSGKHKKRLSNCDCAS